MRYVLPSAPNQYPSLEEIRSSLKPDVRNSLTPIIPSLLAAYQSFDAAIAHNLHTIPSANLSEQAKRTMTRVFEDRLGRFKELIRSLDNHFEQQDESICPYCNLGEQWEHDHYLPKDIFPEFALFPPNLVPICKGCNGKKRTKYKIGNNRIFLYLLSELQNEPSLLEVEITYDHRVTVNYFIAQPPQVQDLLFQVAERHFNALNLGRRYSRQASTTIAKMVRAFRKPKSLALGKARLQARLVAMAEDRMDLHPENHWETVLLRKLAADTQFSDYVFA